MTSFAQGNTVESIRQTYADVRQHINQMMNDEWPREYYHIDTYENLPATGPQKEDIYMYYGFIEGNEEDIYIPHYLQFLTMKYNYSIREFYEEYLYDKKGNLLFFFVQSPDIIDDKVSQVRAWFDGQRLLRFAVSETDFNYYTNNPKDSMQFKQIYAGTTVPETYNGIFQHRKNMAKTYLEMFNAVDNVVQY